MKVIIATLLLFIAAEVSAHPTILKQIVRNKPKIDRKVARKIAQAVHMTSIKYKLNPKVLTAILMQESSYQLDAVNCRGTVCHDFGLSQINARTIKAYNFKIPLLMTDYHYSIDAAGKVLYDIKKSRPKEKQYWTRYNTSKPTLRIAYYNKVSRWM